ECRQPHREAELRRLRCVDVGERVYPPTIRILKAEWAENQLANHEWLVHGRISPQIRPEVLGEQPVRGAYPGLSVTSRIPSQSQSRRQVVGVGRDQTSTNARVSWKNHAQRRARHHFGLLARKKSVGP